MEKELSKIKELDKVLEVISKITYPIIHLVQIEVELEKIPLILEQEHLNSIIQKLIKDGYVTTDKQTIIHKLIRYNTVNPITEEITNVLNSLLQDKTIPYAIYSMTWEGMYFIEVLGGYQEEKNRENLNNGRIERQAKLTNRFALWAAFGTVGILIVELRKILIANWDWISQWFCHC